jgi:hypothetical protein
MEPLLYSCCEISLFCGQSLPGALDSQAKEHMTAFLATIVASAKIQRLALIGLSKNVGKTTATNHLLETLISENLYLPDELALTSLGLDGEATDVLTGLPKPRYIPQAGLLVATTADLLRQAENEGAQVQRLQQLPARTALGPVVLARILRPGRVIIAGPTLLRELRYAMDQLQASGAYLGIVDGAVNRLGAAVPNVTDACILCTGASAAATPELVARRTADVLLRLSIQPTQWMDAYKQQTSQARLYMFSVEDGGGTIENYTDVARPENEAHWIATLLHAQQKPVFVIHGAFTEELSRALLAYLPVNHSSNNGELIVQDGTKIFCPSVVLQRLSARGLTISVANPIRVLALTSNPYTPEYLCSSQHLLDVLGKELPPNCPPIIDVISGRYHNEGNVTS